MASATRLSDGSFDFSGGVDSGRVPTIATDLAPNGLKRNQLAWAGNCTVRGGGVTCRNGWTRIKKIADDTRLYQGGFLYRPISGSFPYLMLSIGGQIIQQNLDEPYQTIDQSANFSLSNPSTAEYAYFAQGEQFLVIQAGDYTVGSGATLPLFWNGSTLRRSVGITSSSPGTNPGVNEIPAAGPMCYYAGRLWYAGLRSYAAGDIVNGGSAYAGDPASSILQVTENPLAIGGDGFAVPAEVGNIRALAYTQALNTTLGQGPLYIFTRSAIYQLVVPVTRTAWIAANDANQPQQTLAQLKFGTYSDRSIVAANGDLFYKSPDGIRSLNLSVRNFGQWGNVPISNNEERVFNYEDRSLLRYTSGVLFSNRLLMAALPTDTPVGPAFQGIIPLDFELISTLEEQKPPAWEGLLEGMNVLQLFEGDFGGRDRCFAVCYSSEDPGIWLWELTDDLRFDYDDKRVTWYIETPAFTFGKELELKQLDGLELWINRLFGTVAYTVEYRPDGDPCWRFWHRGTMCSARSSCEDSADPVCYPEQPYGEGYRTTLTLPKPPAATCANQMARPSDQAFQFQLRITFEGWCSLRGLIIHAQPKFRQPYDKIVC